MNKSKRPTGPSKDTVEFVWERDKGRCAMCGRYLRFEGRGVEWSLHHRSPRGMGGSTLEWKNLPANLVVLCGSGTTGCHGYVESHREHAEDLGFIVRSGSFRFPILPSTVQIKHFLYGVVYLPNQGEPHRTPAYDI